MIQGFNLERLSAHHPSCIKCLWIGLRDLSYLENIWLEHTYHAKYYFYKVITKKKRGKEEPTYPRLLLGQLLITNKHTSANTPWTFFSGWKYLCKLVARSSTSWHLHAWVKTCCLAKRHDKCVRGLMLARNQVPMRKIIQSFSFAIVGQRRWKEQLKGLWSETIIRRKNSKGKTASKLKRYKEKFIDRV